jgi:RNA polymerase sigma factor (sigma-70 family)
MDRVSAWGRSLAELLARHRDALIAVATRRTRDRTAAADIVSDVYARLLGTQSRGSEIDDTRILFASVRNAAIEHQRALARRSDILSRLVPDQIGPDHCPAPDAALEAREALSALDRALLELSPRTREIFILHRIDGMPNREIAARYGISVSAVEKHLARAMLHCQARLANHLDRL